MISNNLTFQTAGKEEVLQSVAPAELQQLSNHQSIIPKLARNEQLLREIDSILPNLPTFHRFYRQDSRKMEFLQAESLHLVLTSPPYWTLKEYHDSPGQLGHMADYEEFLEQLDRVWQQSYEALVPGGRLICVVGDVCLSRKKNGRHTVVPLHASIQEHCRRIGFDNLAPIIWYKIANANYEVEGGSSFLGKPYEPNGVVKNDIEFILMQRKPGGYRTPSLIERAFSVISEKKQKVWFNQIWSGLPGASTKNHPAPYPLELACRLIRMFSFVGDLVLDPFSGSGTTALAAWQTGRNSVSCEIDKQYFDQSIKRFEQNTRNLTSRHLVDVYR